jgi:hypothetical protein
MKEIRDDQRTEVLFREGQEENQPPFAQNFFDYWGDDTQTEDFS